MKIAYCGIDLFKDCLLYVARRPDMTLERIFTYSNDPYDTTDAVTAYARQNGIPCQTARVTEEDIRSLERSGVSLLLVAGYPARIPVSERIRQVNVHPALLPEGRGAFPMPLQILRGIPSGVTLHQLSPRFDEGDILLQRAVPLAPQENLESLTEKLRKTAVALLETLFSDFDRIWENRQKQTKGSYWQEPGDALRTLTPQSTVKEAALILRAFYGYGVLYDDGKTVTELRYGKAAVGIPPAGRRVFPRSYAYFTEI